MPVPMLSATVTVRPQDIYDPFLYSRGNIKRWVGALFASYVIYSTRQIWSPNGFQQGAARWLLLILLAVLVLVVVFLYPYFRIRSFFDESPQLQKSRRISFSEEGIHIESEDARGDYKWAVFRNIVETPKVFMFMQTTRSAGGFYVPKRCLSEPADVGKLRKLIRANFAGKARLRPD